jgi:hypothetical protein
MKVKSAVETEDIFRSNSASSRRNKKAIDKGGKTLINSASS